MDPTTATDKDDLLSRYTVFPEEPKAEVHNVRPPDYYKISHSAECREKDKKRLPFERTGNDRLQEVPTNPSGNIYKLRFDPKPDYSEFNRVWKHKRVNMLIQDYTKSHFPPKLRNHFLT